MTRLRIVVLGYIIRGPFGGMAWHHLQYVLGLTRLGHDIYFFEEAPRWFVNRVGRRTWKPVGL